MGPGDQKSLNDWRFPQDGAEAWALARPAFITKAAMETVSTFHCLRMSVSSS
jgi:hypothetical protein